MHDELTREDIRKMKEELDYRRLELMPGLIEEVKRTRAFGDLSENYEYKAAKQAQNQNRSRMRYLEGMIKTAKIIDDTSDEESVGLFDEVEIYMPEDDDTEIIRVVTTVRCDPRKGLATRARASSAGNPPSASRCWGRKSATDSPCRWMSTTAMRRRSAPSKSPKTMARSRCWDIDTERYEQKTGKQKENKRR